MKTKLALWILTAILVAGFSANLAQAADENWPQFLGPGARAGKRQRQPAGSMVGQRERRLEDRHCRTRLVVAYRLGKPRLSDRRRRRRERQREAAAAEEGLLHGQTAGRR